MDNRLQHRVVIITGGSSGLGKATALRFANSGAKIILADLASSGVEEEINSQHGNDRAVFVKTDVTQESEIKALVQQAVEFGGRVDILANFAGIAVEKNHTPPINVHDFPVEDFDKTWAINVRGGWLCCKYAIAEMMKQEPREANLRGDRTRGWVLNIASIYGLVGGENLPAYIPSKHAVVGMTKQMAARYATDRIHVNCICPGYTKTAMTETVTSDSENQKRVENWHPWKAMGIPEDIANAALFLCSDDASWVTGTSLAVDGGYSIV